MLDSSFRIKQIFENMKELSHFQEFVTESNDYLEFLMILQPSKAMI